MKNVSWDYLFCALFLGSFYSVFMQGFAAPSLSTAGNLIFRILAAASIQLFFCRRKWPIIVRLLPLFLTGAFALWGCWLHIQSPTSWRDSAKLGLFVDYLSPAISCLVIAALHRLPQTTRR